MDKQSPPYTVTILYANDKAFRDTICGDIVNLSYYEEVAKLGSPGHVAFNLEEQEAIYSHCQNRDKHWNEEKPCRSMSMGDILRNDATGEMVIVARCGFEPYVEPKGQCENRTGGGRYQCDLPAGHIGKHKKNYPIVEWDD